MVAENDNIVYINVQECILTGMKYDKLVGQLGRQGFFDLATVVQLTDEKRESLCIQLSRWCRSGKLISLRRGMYAFPDAGRSAKINPAVLANRLYSPSYISSHWALGYYGLIPERVVIYTSVTQRVPSVFENPFGTFRYQHIKREAFFGYQILSLSNQDVVMASPEKALLDFWHLERGEWTHKRMGGMRFQNMNIIDQLKLQQYADAYRSPRLCHAAALWCSMAEDEEEGREL